MKMASTVAESVPPMMPVPIATQLLAPAPEATASGNTPAMKANEVMRIGLKRSEAACGWSTATAP